MNSNEVLNGSVSFAAMGFAQSTLVNQLGFLLGVAVTRLNNDATRKPLFDASIAAALEDNGQPQWQKLDADDLLKGYAAAFTGLYRHTVTPNPETGRKEEYLARFLRPPSVVLKDAADYQNERRSTTAIASARATAAMLDVDPSKRIETIKTEAAAQKQIDVGPYETMFVTHLTAMKKWDKQALIDCACESLTNAGRNPGKEIEQAAKMFLDSQKKRMLNGDFVAIDAGIFTLAGIKAKVAEVVAPATTEVTTAAVAP